MADTEVVLVMRNFETGELRATNFRVIHCYPDTTDEHGKHGSSFKIEVAERLPDAR